MGMGTGRWGVVMVEGRVVLKTTNRKTLSCLGNGTLVCKMNGVFHACSRMFRAFIYSDKTFGPLWRFVRMVR